MNIKIYFTILLYLYYLLGEVVHFFIWLPNFIINDNGPNVALDEHKVKWNFVDRSFDEGAMKIQLSIHGDTLEKSLFDPESKVLKISRFKLRLSLIQADTRIINSYSK